MLGIACKNTLAAFPFDHYNDNIIVKGITTLKRLQKVRLPLPLTLLAAVLLAGCITLLALWCQPNALRVVLAHFKAQPLLVVLNTLPIGMLVKSMQWVIKIFPVSHAALLFRNLMMQRSMDAAFEGAPEELITEIKEQLGVVYFVGDSELALWVSVLYMAVCVVLFFALASVRLSGKRVR